MKSSALPEIYIISSDFERLSQLIHRSRTPAAADLEEEISRAVVVAQEDLPFHVVTMNSTVRFRDLDTGKESQVTLVYPEEADVKEGKISVLAPVGAALIGMPAGQVIEWPVPGGKSRQIQVVEIEDVNRAS